MCLIILKPQAVTIPVELIKSAFAQNHDGWGMMWAEDGELRIIKGMDLEGLLKNVEAIQNKTDVFVHLRMATHGVINEQNTHPFDVVADEGDRILSMMHNGIISGLQPDKNGESSDTKLFVDVIGKTLQEYPELIFKDRWQQAITEFVRENNRLAFLNKDGGYCIINYDSGIEWEGLWLSNTYAWDSRNHHLIADGTWSASVQEEKEKWGGWWNQSYWANNRWKYQEIEEEMVENYVSKIDEILHLGDEEMYKMLTEEPQLVYDLILEDDQMYDKIMVKLRSRNLWETGYRKLWNILLENPDAIYEIFQEEIALRQERVAQN